MFSPEKFELPKAFFATAQSVWDALIINWNATYDYYESLNVKQAYYLSMELLQGRALLNAIGNLELTGPYAEALSKLGHKLEDVACQHLAILTYEVDKVHFEFIYNAVGLVIADISGE
ncbi:hypothetical protein K1719_037543 [Acacia pycnantha]|nr:hypothetical protein K1719_037543 [Acacia pycnantha]